MPTLTEMQSAARMIETDGAGAFFNVRMHYGEEVAKTLLIAHLRRSYGAMEEYPVDVDIDEKVKEYLIDNDFMRFFSG